MSAVIWEDLCDRLGLAEVARLAGPRAEQAATTQQPYTAYLTELLQAEVDARQHRYVTSRVQMAHLPFRKPLETFDFRFQPSVDERQIRECYQTQPHSAVPNFPSPEAAFRADPEPLRFVEVDTLAAAFQRVDTRKVDKAGCISFGNRKYEVGVTWVGQTVEVVYDPQSTEELTIEVPNHPPWLVRPLVIGEHAGRRPALPDHLTPTPATHSRVLRAAEAQGRPPEDTPAPAVSYREMADPGGGSRV